METTPNGVILILHQGFTTINEQDCIDALPNSWKVLQRQTIRVTYSQDFSLADGQDINFTQFAYEHKQQFKREILPVIEKNKDHVIAYFGLVPVPLGIDFGHLFFNYNTIEIFQWHHKHKVWYQETDQSETSGDSTIITSELPDPNQKGLQSVLVRMSLAHTVMPHATDEVLPNAAEIDISFKEPDEDAIDTREKMIEVGEVTQHVFDQLSENASGLDVIHLFAAIPCGPAFLIGTKISPNVHPFIQTYQYKNTGKPKYRKAILVKQKLENTKVIVEEDRKRAEELRRLADHELRSAVNSFCNHNREAANGRLWPKDVIFIEEPGVMNEPMWSQLPPIHETGLQHDQCSIDPETLENGAKRLNHKWHIDDFFITGIAERIESEEDIKQAFRLFFFHEVLHDVQHNLGNGKAEGVESFPKVLEMADYQADVYALLNEYGFQKHCWSGVENSKQHFLSTIQILLETAWSQHEDQQKIEHIQIRELNRFLIWHWQHIKIQHSDGSTGEIVKILEEKPLIELSGLRSLEKNGRFYFDLNERFGAFLEMAIFHQNKVLRAGASSNFNIQNLIDGLKEKNSERILQELMRFYPE